MADKEYLRIIGKLKPGNKLQLRPCYLTMNASNLTEQGMGPVYVEYFNEQDKKTNRIHIVTEPYRLDGYDTDILAVRGKIQFTPGTVKVRFTHENGETLHELLMNKEKPSISLQWKPSKSRTLKGVNRIRYKGLSHDDQALQYFLEYTNDDGNTWWRIGSRTNNLELDVDFDRLPGGDKCKIAVVVTDGLSTNRVISDSFSVSVKKCKASIISPRPGTVIPYGTEVILRGRGYYSDEMKPELKKLLWSSSIDGKLGSGMTVIADKLSRGSHTITLLAGSQTRLGKEEVHVIVR